MAGMIQGIDGSALIQAFRAGRNDRYAIEDRERENAAADEERQHKRQVRGLIGQLYDEPPSVASQFGAPEATAPQTFGEAPTAEMGAAPVQAQAPAPTAPRRQVNRDVLTQLVLLDPETGGRIASALKTMDDAALEQAEKRNSHLGATAHWLRQFPVQERAARLQAVAPALMEQGFSQEQLASAAQDLSDERLGFFEANAVDYDKLIDNERAEREDQLQQEDREEDNARADRAENRQSRNTDSLVRQRGRSADTAERRQETAEQREQRLRDSPRGDGRGGGGSGNSRIVSVSTPEEARRLPRGTRFRTPDGRVKIR